MKLLDPALAALFSQSVKRPLILVKAHWPSGIVCMHDGMGEQMWDSYKWYGLGGLGSISPIGSGENEGQLNLTLRTTSEAQIAEVLQDDAVGSQIDVYLAGLDDKMRIAAAQLFYVGFVNQVPVEYTNPSSISIELVDEDYRWNSPREHSRYTASAQRARSETDSFCDDVERIAKGPLSSYSQENTVGTIRHGGSNGGYIP